MPQRLRATVAPPNCILCDGPAAPPSRMGWLQTPDRQAVFCVCGKCSDCADTELEATIVAHVSGAPKAHIGPTPAAAADHAPAKRVTAAAREWVQPAQPAA